jgi:hypothetical protein
LELIHLLIRSLVMMREVPCGASITIFGSYTTGECPPSTLIAVPAM